MKQLLISAISLTISFVLTAQNIQPPSNFMGYELGENFTYHHKVVDYYEYVASQMPNVQVESYGMTNERRPLITAFVTSPKNMQQLEDLRENHLSKAGITKSDKKANVKQLPIVWLSYNIHGDEAAGTEAALQTLYTLATDATKAKWLEEVIVVIDPCENPDGRDRYVNWYNQVMNNPVNPADNSMEHHQPWPGGRYNHYLFDLNRDWAWQTQIESRQRAILYHQWMPHVHVDLHEQGIDAPYFFAPAAHPLHESITEWQRDFMDKVGANNAKYFDKEGWLYFTNEVFDLLYPSYGDTWPTFNGSVGFTYEQGGSRRAGVKAIEETGNYLTLTDRWTHHYMASLSTIETAYNNRKKLVEAFNDFFKTASNSPIGDYQSYVIKGTNDIDNVNNFITLLENQNIKVNSPKTTGRKLSGFDYLNNKTSSFQLEENDIVISAYQPMSHLLSVLFEPKTALEDSLTYDLTAWAIPYAYQLEAFAVKEKIETKTYQPPMVNSVMIPEDIPYGIVSSWKSIEDAKFLGALLEEGIKVRFTENAFTMNEQQFDRGSLIITRADNRQLEQRYDDVVKQVAKKIGKNDLFFSKSGRVSTGRDFGSNSVNYIKPPKVAIVGGDGVSPMAFGEVWYYFEQVIKYPVTTLHSDYISSVDLNNYNVIILPSGSYGRMNMNSSFMDFVRNGGKVIAMENAVRNLAVSGQTQLEIDGIDKAPTDKEKKYEGRHREDISTLVAGSIYKVTVDESHPLAYGYDGSVHIMKRNSTIYPLISSGEWNVGVFKKNSHVSGFVGHELKKSLDNTLAFGTESFGRGDIVYFADSPIFRGFWYGGNLLFANAVFFVGQ